MMCRGVTADDGTRDSILRVICPCCNSVLSIDAGTGDVREWEEAKDPRKTADLKDEIDVRPVVIKSTKGRIPRRRPIFKNWSLKFTIEYDEDEISAETIKEILDYAGRRVGIGDFRPENGGPFGRFMVTKFK